ncbi:MAG: hypothetical protein LBS41_03730 [Streptococcaceae bacterium]|jgi:hypothetical protein|nr:hypothetical protein [Streptococcaceae bacterium]
MGIKEVLKKAPGLQRAVWAYRRRPVHRDPIGSVHNSYQKAYHRPLHLDKPQYFTEKLQWLKLFAYPYNPLVVQAADKYTLKQYLREHDLAAYETPYIEVLTDVNQIDLSRYPQSFVMKKTNASGMNLIVKDKSKVSNKTLRRIASQWLKEDFGYNTAERHYSQAQDRIMIEPMFDLGDEYRCFMVAGKFAFVQVIVWDWTQTEQGNEVSDGVIQGHAKHYRVHIDADWQVTWKEPGTPKVEIAKPAHFDEMIRVAHQIGQDFPIVRVDFQMVDQQLKIGELTLTPGSGFMLYFDVDVDVDVDVELGTWLPDYGGMSHESVLLGRLKPEDKIGV